MNLRVEIQLKRGCYWNDKRLAWLQPAHLTNRSPDARGTGSIWFGNHANFNEMGAENTVIPYFLVGIGLDESVD